MSSIEKKVKRGILRETTLNVLATAGLVSAALIAPNVLGALGKLGFLKKFNNNFKYSYFRNLNSLKKAGLITIRGTGRNIEVEITSKGKEYISKKILQTKIKKKWDGRWRVLIFDIPETHRSKRNLIRRELLNVGFVMLQKSVWVYPYDCEDLITLLKAESKIGLKMIYMVVYSIEGEDLLKKTFGFKT